MQVLPVALLLATFLALGQLNKFGELTAMRAAGLSLLRILRAGVRRRRRSCALVSLAARRVRGAGGEPRARRDLRRADPGHPPRRRSTERADVTYLGAGGRIFYMRLYLVREQRMHEVSLQEFRSGDAGAPHRRGRGAAGTAGAGCSRRASCATFDGRPREGAGRSTRMAVNGHRRAARRTSPRRAAIRTR